MQALSVEFSLAGAASFSQLLGGANCSTTVTARELTYARQLLSAYVEVHFFLVVKSGLELSSVDNIIKECLADGDFLLILSNKTGLALTAAPDSETRNTLSPSKSPLQTASSSSSSSAFKGIIQ